MRPTILVAAALLAVPVLAQPAPMSTAPDADAVGRVSAGTYQSDPQHTLVRWSVDHFGITPYTGLFGQVTGTLTLDPANLAAAKVEMTIPVASVTTASDGLTNHLLRAAKDGGSPDFFGADPAAARFVSTSVVPTGATTAVVTGDLTLNGVTRPVRLAARFYGAGTQPANMGGKEQVGFTATGAMTRSEWGVGYAVPGVSDTVELNIAAAFQK